MRPRLWWVPLVLLLAPVLGRVPLPRDVPGYFLPMREFTADRLLRGGVPWLNPLDGCTEAWFANPQTGILYPPRWLHLVLPAGVALTAEVALHLALFSLGVGLLSRRFGAEGPGIAVAEGAAWSAGAVVGLVGMLNNLEALAWVPWMVLAGQAGGRRGTAAVAAACALGWVAGEPVVWLPGCGLALAAAPRRAPVLAGLGLGLGVAAVQLVPFAAWVAEGDRGGGAAAEMVAGALAPAGLARLLVPGVPAAGTGSPWIASLFLGAPLLGAALLGLRRRAGVAVLAGGLALLAVLPALGGEGLYLALTGGLVRYPSRFAVLAVCCLLPFTGPGAERWLAGEGGRVGLLLGGVSLALLPRVEGPVELALVVLPAGLLVVAAVLPGRRVLRGAALAAGIGAAVAAGWPLLGLAPPREAPWPWPAMEGAGRVYTQPTGPRLRAWLGEDPSRWALWPAGYANLRAGVALARTGAPLAMRGLAEHLAAADQGPPGRWWLDTLAARRVLVLGPPAPGSGLVPLESRRGVWLLDNPGVLPVAVLWGERPRPGAGLAPGVVSASRPAPELIRVATAAPRVAFLSVALPPIRGWEWTVDGRETRPERGPGILQVFRLPPGSHEVVGRYRPPGYPAAAFLSGLALLVLGVMAVGGGAGTGSDGTAAG